MSWDQTKPGNNSALVAAEVRGNFAELQARLGDINLNPMQIAAALNFLAGINFSVLPTGIGSMKLGRCTADFIKNANTTLGDITGMSFSIAASETWLFLAALQGISVAAADWKFAITAPAAPTGIRYGLVESVGNTLGSTGTAGTALTVNANGVEQMVFLAGLIRNGANAGSIQAQMAQQTSDASNSTIRADSFIVGLRMA